jgi:hypothetical protein
VSLLALIAGGVVCHYIVLIIWTFFVNRRYYRRQHEQNDDERKLIESAKGVGKVFILMKLSAGLVLAAGRSELSWQRQQARLKTMRQLSFRKSPSQSALDS